MNHKKIRHNPKIRFSAAGPSTSPRTNGERSRTIRKAFYTFLYHRRMKSLIMTDYVDGNLKGRTLEECESHLQSCPNCRALSEELIAAGKLFGAVPRQEAPAGVWLKIQSEISAEPARPRFAEVVFSQTRYLFCYANLMEALVSLRRNPPSPRLRRDFSEALAKESILRRNNSPKQYRSFLSILRRRILPRLKPAVVMAGTAMLILLILTAMRLMPLKYYPQIGPARDNIFMMLHGNDDANASKYGFGTPAEEYFL